MYNVLITATVVGSISLIGVADQTIITRVWVTGKQLMTVEVEKKVTSTRG